MDFCSVQTQIQNKPRFYQPESPNEHLHERLEWVSVLYTCTTHSHTSLRARARRRSKDKVICQNKRCLVCTQLEETMGEVKQTVNKPI